MTTALDRIADAADEAATDQRAAARKLRMVKRQRDRGWSWVQVMDHGAGREALTLLRRSAGKLATAVRTLSQTVARGLAGDGESRRKIASRLGVTHQRITAMLRK